MKLKTENFGKVQELKYGKALKAKERKLGPIPVYGSNGIIGYHNTPLVKTSGIILGRKGSFGKVHFVKGPFWPIDTTYYIDSSKEFDLEYLFYLLKYMKLDRVNLHVAVPGLSRSDVYKKSISYPKDITDQKRIAKVLSDCEQLIQWRKESIQLLDDYLESTFLEMFGDPVKFKRLPISKIAAHRKYAMSSGPFGSSLTSKHYVPQGVIVLRGKNISSGKLDLSDVKFVNSEKAEELKRSKIINNDIVIVAVGSSGLALKIPDYIPEAIMSQNFNKISPNTEIVTPTYLEYSINSEIVQSQFRKVMTNAGRSFLSLTNIKKVQIPIPDKYLQEDFSKTVAKIELLKSDLNLSLTELNNLYNSISQKAFKGELNLDKVKLQESGEIVIENQKIYGGRNQISDSIINTGKPSETQKGKTKDRIIQDASELSVKELFLSGCSAEVNWTNYLSRKDFNLEDDPLNYLYALYYTFKEREFSFQEIEMKTAASLMLSTNIEYDWKPEEWKNKIFQYLTSSPPYLVQAFNEQEGRIKLKVNYEALTI